LGRQEQFDLSIRAPGALRAVDKSACLEFESGIMEMMANQQLVDYIKQQLQLGVSKEAIRGTLIQVGWAEADINDAFNAATPSTPSPVPGAAGPAAGSVVSVPSSAGPGLEAAAPAGKLPPPEGPRVQAAPSVAAPAAPALTPTASKPASAVSPAFSALSQFPQKTAGGAQSPFVTRDIFQPKDFSRQTVDSSFGSQIQTPPAQVERISLSVSEGSKGKKYLLLAVWVVVFLGLAGGGAYFFWQNRSLKDQISRASEASASLEKANSQVASLTNEKNSLTSQLEAVNREKSDLLLNLSFLVAPPQGATTTEVTVSGVLGGGGKSPYTLTTAYNVVLNVKNSANSDVSKALQPLLGNSVSLSGTYVPGTREITVTAVNGAAVKASSPEGATSTSTSTTP
jgi:hypothetical protein